MEEQAQSANVIHARLARSAHLPSYFTRYLITISRAGRINLHNNQTEVSKIASGIGQPG